MCHRQVTYPDRLDPGICSEFEEVVGGRQDYPLTGDEEEVNLMPYEGETAPGEEKRSAPRMADFPGAAEGEAFEFGDAEESPMGCRQS